MLVPLLLQSPSLMRLLCNDPVSIFSLPCCGLELYMWARTGTPSHKCRSLVATTELPAWCCAGRCQVLQLYCGFLWCYNQQTSLRSPGGWLLLSFAVGALCFKVHLAVFWGMRIHCYAHYSLWQYFPPQKGTQCLCNLKNKSLP